MTLSHSIRRVAPEVCGSSVGANGAVTGGDVTQTEPAQAEVLAHYQGIAADYNQMANRTCERVYGRLVSRFLSGSSRLLELGGGSSEQLGALGTPLAVTCDLSREMLLRRPASDQSHRVVAVGERLPFRDAQFNAIFSINVLEHVADLDAVLAESAPCAGGWGHLASHHAQRKHWEYLLADLAERWCTEDPGRAAPVPDHPNAPRGGSSAT